MIEHSFTINSGIQGYHYYKDGWDAPIAEVIYCEQEIGNHGNPCTVAVKRATLRATASVALWHIPHLIR